MHPKPHSGFHDTIINIWASSILQDDRDRVDIHLCWTYYVAEVHHSHCYTDLRFPLPMEWS